MNFISHPSIKQKHDPFQATFRISDWLGGAHRELIYGQGYHIYPLSALFHNSRSLERSLGVTKNTIQEAVFRNCIPAFACDSFVLPQDDYTHTAGPQPTAAEGSPTKLQESTLSCEKTVTAYKMRKHSHFCL